VAVTTVPVRTYYFEQRQPVLAAPAAGGSVAAGLEVCRRIQPSVEWYLEVYDAVGRAWRWVDRRLMAPVQLGKLLADPLVEVHELRLAGAQAGYAELDRRVAGEIELVYFGLHPSYTGRGLGKQFLRLVLDWGWQYGPERIWLHTCEWDHPGAVRLYRQAGFVQYDEGWVNQRVPKEAQSAADGSTALTGRLGP